jgi:hypothetical protein
VLRLVILAKAKAFRFFSFDILHPLPRRYCAAFLRVNGREREVCVGVTGEKVATDGGGVGGGEWVRGELEVEEEMRQSANSSVMSKRDERQKTRRKKNEKKKCKERCLEAGGTTCA